MDFYLEADLDSGGPPALAGLLSSAAGTAGAEDPGIHPGRCFMNLVTEEEHYREAPFTLTRSPQGAKRTRKDSSQIGS